LSAFATAGIPLRIISGGSTPLLFHSHLIEAMNEIRPGTYIFNDRNTVMGGGCGWADCAASILTTVVSTAKADQVIIDGGSKTFSSDRLSTGEHDGFGVVLDHQQAKFHKMNEEHGFIQIESHRLSVGDRLRIIPNHVCVAVNLHEYVYGVRDNEVIEMWRVEGRGKLQ
jgi:D-serine deaminase-like pyridoxal phosphate-dependent protein